MDFLSKAKAAEARALADGYFSGEAAWLKTLRPLSLMIRFTKWLRGAKFINAVVSAVSTALVYIQSYALLLLFAGAAAVFFSAAVLLFLPALLASYVTAGRKCREDAKRLCADNRPVCFLFTRNDRRVFTDTVSALAAENEVYVVTGGPVLGANGGRRRVKSHVSYVHRAFYHRLRKELGKAGYRGRTAVVI